MGAVCRKGATTASVEERIVFKDFPLAIHSLAPKAAEAAHCAGEQGKYWDMHDRMFANQQALAVPGLKEGLAKVALKSPAVPLISNVEAKPVSDAEAIRGLLLRQLTSPVRWVESMQQALALDAKEAYEVGPGKVLMGLARGISRDMKVTPVENPEDFKA